MRWLGIDFSGDHTKWRPGCRSSNVWIATLSQKRGWLALADLRQVQELAGGAPPFVRLAARLAAGDFAAAAIDAPFSVPERFVPGGQHVELLGRVAALGGRRRPFPRGEQLLLTLAPTAPLRGLKAYRATEELWRRRKLNVRAPLWVKPRGGAPMTAACLSLLWHSNRPIWPWAQRARRGLLVEGFPAAQLKQWQLPHQGYSGRTAKARGRRVQVIDALAEHLVIGEASHELMCASADALDAVVCAFGAVAVTRGALLDRPGPEARAEGWIAVHQ